MDLWFIKPSYADRVEKIFNSNLIPSEIQMQNFKEYKAASRSKRRSQSNEVELPAGMSIHGETATVEIKGVLTKELSFWAWFFDLANTSYNDIIESVAVADADPEVKQIEFIFDSGGGNVSGMFDAMKAIKNSTKPTTAIIDDLAASAAYGLASQADEILAAGPAVMVGSIGVAVDMRVSDSVVSISSTNAPNKRPDVTTDEGRAIVRGELDALHEIFASEIASGRGITSKDVNKKFGKGGILLADAAQKAGMIDGFYESEELDSNDNGNAEASADVKFKGEYMDKAQLKAQFPQLYSEIFSEGISAERDRVKGHLKMAATFGAEEFGRTCIEDGTKFEAITIAEYIALKEGKKQTEARVEDAVDADPGTPSDKTRDEGDVVADLVLAQFGLGEATA